MIGYDNDMISLTISDFQSSSTKVVLVKVDHIYVISTRYSANFHSTEKALAGSRVETIMPVIINLCFFHLHLFVDYPGGYSLIWAI